MFIFLPILLLIRIFTIFDGFTFTDAIDFTPMLTLAVGLCSALALGIIRRERKPSGALIAAVSGLSLWPLLPNLGLFFLAFEFQKKTGSWPEVMADDPKGYLDHLSPTYDALFSLVDYLDAFSGAWLIVFGAVLLACWPKFSKSQRRFFIGATLSSLLWVLLDPGSLYAWWLD